MATTRESIEDGVRWVLKVLRIGVRRAFTMAIFVALFAAAVVWTTRERVSDCSDVADSQRDVLASLLVEDPGRSFRAVSAAECVDGVFRSLIVGVDGEIDADHRSVGRGGMGATDRVHGVLRTGVAAVLPARTAWLGTRAHRCRRRPRWRGS